LRSRLHPICEHRFPGFTRFAVEVPKLENSATFSMERCGKNRSSTGLSPVAIRSAMAFAATYDPVIPHLLNPVATYQRGFSRRCTPM